MLWARGVPVPAARGGSSPGTCGIIPAVPQVSPWRHWEHDAGASMCQDGDGSGPAAPGLGSEAGFWRNGWITRNPHQLRDCAVPGGSWMGVLGCQQGSGCWELCWAWRGMLGREPWGILGRKGYWRQREETEGAGWDTGNAGTGYWECRWRYWRWRGDTGGRGEDAGLMLDGMAGAGGACWGQGTARGAAGGTQDTLGVTGAPQLWKS